MSLTNEKKGFAGKISEIFVNSKLTIVIILVSLIAGIAAVILTPKEEEPQIIVPMIDIETFVPGYDAKRVEKDVTEVIERSVWGLDGVEYVYSMSRAHGNLITVRFKVNENLEDGLVKIHHKLQNIKNELPNVISSFNVKSYSIDDVPFLTLTFSSSEYNDYELRQLIAPIARELSSTEDLSRIELIGGQKRTIRISADKDLMEKYGVNLYSIEMALKNNHAYFPVGTNWSDKEVYDIEIGGQIKSKEDIEDIAVGQRGGKIIHIHDIAKVLDGPEVLTKASRIIKKQDSRGMPAVTIVLAKRKGTNVVKLSENILERTSVLLKTLPPSVQMDITRNYGETARDKSNELIEHLLIATFSVAVLMALAMGIRAALIVGIAIPVTLALTLLTYYFLGHTLNRVTLFALIFSIGILVDDAIVVVENIERHLKIKKEGESFLRTILKAVSEVGNPTILATFTVIAAILPMAFVRGLMGPYMAPIPVGASISMIFSLLVAFIITPWASFRLLKNHSKKHDCEEGAPEKESKLDKIYRKFMSSLIKRKRSSIYFSLFTVLLLVFSMGLVATKTVKVKMLPFDNKTEFQVLLDYPPTTPLKDSIAWTTELAQKLVEFEDIEMVQVYSGVAAPYSFSGMVKHTFLRNSENMSDLQIVLKDKDKRKTSSHDVIRTVSKVIYDYAKSKNALSKVLEIPPGPPVMATMVAEVYGPSDEERLKTAEKVYDVFKNESSVVDLDYSWREMRPRKIYTYNQVSGGRLGASAGQLIPLGISTFSENHLYNLDTANSPEEVPVLLSLNEMERKDEKALHDQNVMSFESGLVDVKDILNPPTYKKSNILYRKNLRPVMYVMSELSGEEEAPVYGMLKITPELKDIETQTAEVPWNTSKPIVKWDGEWFITYEVFRDLGAAFLAVITLIYILVVGWFKSFSVPLIIMIPIPISLIGILPGHALTGTFFTATSMIGFIAGAGIIVRNSIILVDFIEQQLKSGLNLKESVISAGVIRFRPMLLTAAAVVVGSAVMLKDPIFQGLAISLIFGEVAATLLSRFMIPILYYWFVGKRRQKLLQV